MRTFAALSTLLALALSATAAPPPVLRKAPEFTIAEPSGKQILLSSFKGKVVIAEFLYTTCPHCQRESQLLSKLYKEMAPRGVQMVGVAFNDNAAMLVPQFVQQFQVNYPVGAANPDAVINFLGFNIMDRYVVPQVAVIDRKGNIRVQTPPMGDESLYQETYLRNLIEGLLKETPTTSAKNTAGNH
jgi:peroxiredoxin